MCGQHAPPTRKPWAERAQSAGVKGTVQHALDAVAKLPGRRSTRHPVVESTVGELVAIDKKITASTKGAQDGLEMSSSSTGPARTRPASPHLYLRGVAHLSTGDRLALLLSHPPSQMSEGNQCFGESPTRHNCGD